MQEDQTKRDKGLNSTEKGKRGEYFNNNSEKCNLIDILFILSSQGMGMSHQVDKVSFEGDECLVECMQYILLALVYFFLFFGGVGGGGIIDYSLLIRGIFLCKGVCVVHNRIFWYVLCAWENICVVKEESCQAREHFLQVRVCWKLFPGALGISCSSLRLLDLVCC
jgi:hypothetical protein